MPATRPGVSVTQRADDVGDSRFVRKGYYDLALHGGCLTTAGITYASYADATHALEGFSFSGLAVRIVCLYVLGALAYLISGGGKTRPQNRGEAIFPLLVTGTAVGGIFGHIEESKTFGITNHLTWWSGGLLGISIFCVFALLARQAETREIDQ